MKQLDLLDRILAPAGLSIVFQPIFQHRPHAWHLYGFEALARGPSQTNLENPHILFEYVRRKRAEPIVDRACVALAMRAANHLGKRAHLGINVHASTLEQDPDFAAFLSRMAHSADFPLSALIIEIVEHSPIWSGEGFRNALGEMRDLGISIALDDVGLGHSNHRMILECRPDYFKVDQYLVNGSSTDFHRRAVLRSISDLAARFGAQVVAEGVECQGDLQAVLGEGIGLVQGFLLSRPVEAATVGPHLVTEANQHYPRKSA